MEATPALVDKGEQFLVIDPQTRPGDKEIKPVLEENAALKDELMEVRAELTQEHETVAALRAELSKCKEQECGDLASEVESLKLQLKEQEKKNKRMWRLQCMQSREQEDIIACQQREIEHLKGASDQGESPSEAELSPLGSDSGGMTSHQEVPNQDGSVVVVLVSPCQVAQPVISPPSPSVLGEPTTPSPPRAVQLASPVTTPATPPSSGCPLPVPAICRPDSACKGKAAPFNTFSGVGKVDIVYHPGKDNSCADALSWNLLPFDGEVVDDKLQVAQVKTTEQPVEILSLMEFEPSFPSHSDFDKEQRKDPN